MSNGLWKCEDCGEIVEQSKAHHCESVPPEPPTPLSDTEREQVTVWMARNPGTAASCLLPRVWTCLVVAEATVAALRAEIAAAKSDSELLDWMEDRVHGTGDSLVLGGVCTWGIEIQRGRYGKPRTLGEGADLREAIEDAIESERAARSASGEDASHDPGTGQTP